MGWIPIAGKGRGLRQPLFAGDLALLLMQTLQARSHYEGVFTVGGRDKISYRELVEAVFIALDKKPRLISFPVPLYAACLKLLSLVRPGTGVSREMAMRQNRDLDVDNGLVQECFEFSPGRIPTDTEPFEPTIIRVLWDQ